MIVAGDMNDYDGLVLDSFSHKPTSMALKLMTQPEGNLANRLFSAGEHVKAADRFTDWCAACLVHFCVELWGFILPQV